MTDPSSAQLLREGLVSHAGVDEVNVVDGLFAIARSLDRVAAELSALAYARTGGAR